MDNSTFKSELGLLGLLGYRVGNDGLLASQRKKLLDRVWGLPISPRVREQVENWAEWGEPRSSARFQKLTATLSTFANRPSMKQASADWKRDLEYVMANFLVDGVRSER